MRDSACVRHDLRLAEDTDAVSEERTARLRRDEEKTNG